jgi:hypothetical protein
MESKQHCIEPKHDHATTYGTPELCDMGQVTALTKGGKGRESEDYIVWGNDPVATPAPDLDSLS